MFDILPARQRGVIRRAIVTRCEAVAESGFRMIGRSLQDLSAEGAFLATFAEVDVGEEVYLSFQAPRTGLWMDAVARVVRKVPGRRSRDFVRGVGLVFERLDAADRAVLEASIRRTPPPVPARARRMDYAGAVAAISAS